MIDQAIKDVASDLKSLIRHMTPEERLEVFSTILEGYCCFCGCDAGSQCDCVSYN